MAFLTVDYFLRFTVVWVTRRGNECLILSARDKADVATEGDFT